VNFVTPLWLVAAGAVALPVLIHLIRTEHFQRCELATIRFIVAAVRERGGRRRIANWPLLLMRAAAVIALALLLARPFLTGAEPPPERGGEALILCDVSGSQARRDGLDLAALVRRSVARLPAGMPVTLVRFAESVEIAKGETALRPIPGAGTDLARAVEWAIDRRAQAGGRPGRVIFISDFPREALRGLSPRLWPAGTTVQLEPTGDKNAWNLGIENVELLTPVATGDVEVEVTLRGSGQVPRQPVRVLLKHDGSAPPLEQSLPAGQMRARFRWKASIPAEGLLARGTAELQPPEGDALAADDLRPFAFAIARQRAVLLVDGDPGETVFGNETYFLDKALVAVLRPGEVPFFRTEMRRQLGNPGGFDVVALCNVAALSPAEAEALRGFVEAGGNVLVTTGSRTMPALFDSLAMAGVVFGKISAAAAPGLQAGELTEPAHPALRGLGAAAADDWRQIAFWRALNLQPARGAKVLAAFADRSPLLVEAAPAGRSGRALAFLHSVDRQDSELPREPLFVPWARELFRYLTRASEPPWQVRNVAPTLGELRAPGIYSDKREVTVIAPAAGEIDVVPARLEEARAALGASSPPRAEASSSPVASSLAAHAPGHLRPRELWPIAAVTLFLLLLAETLLAARPATIRP
jgi:hypothetical protein